MRTLLSQHRIQRCLKQLQKLQDTWGISNRKQKNAWIITSCDPEQIEFHDVSRFVCSPRESDQKLVCIFLRLIETYEVNIIILKRKLE